MSRLKQLGKDSLVYGLGGILARSISFFTLPIYTRIFTPTDYGTIEMLSVLSSFLAAILVMGMDSAQSMYFFKEKDKGQPAQAGVVTAILQWRLVWGSAFVLLATFCAPLLSAAFFNGRLSWEYFALAFFSALFSQILSQSAEVMRLLYRPWSYIGVTLSQSVLGAALVLLFVLVFNQGILGFFAGAGVASIAVAFFGWYRIREYLRFDRIHLDWWPRLVRFGAPLLPAGLAMYFMSTADRWFVQHYHGAHALGLYAVGAKFSLVMALGVETFRKAWWPIAMDSMTKDDGPETFRMIARLYMGVGTALILILTFMSPWLIKWLTGPEFHQGWPTVGVLAWQSLFYGFFLIASVGIWKTEKTYLNLYLMGGAATLGLFLNWLLVPEWSAMGAAVATALTYFVWLIASMIVSERLWYLGFPWKVLALQICIGIGFTTWFVTQVGRSDSLFAFILLAVGVTLLTLSSFSRSRRA